MSSHNSLLPDITMYTPALYFAHCCLQYQLGQQPPLPLWLRQTVAIAPAAPVNAPNERCVYLSNNTIYLKPQASLLPSTFEPDMLLITTDFKKFSAEAVETQSAEAVHIVKTPGATGALFRDANRRGWATDFGVDVAVRARTAKIIKRRGQHESNAEQKSTMKTVRELLRHEGVIKTDKTTNSISVFQLATYLDTMKTMLTTLADVEHAAKQRRIDPTKLRTEKYLETVEWYGGRFDRLNVPEELKETAERLFKANHEQRKLVNRIIKYLKQASVSFDIVQNEEDTKNRIYGALVESGITSDMIAEAENDDTFLLSKTDSGCCVAASAHAIERALQCALYGFAQYQDWPIIKDVFLTCQVARSKGRKCIKSYETFSAKENENILGIKRTIDSDEPNKLAAMAMEQQRWPKKNQLDKDIKRWKPKVPFNIKLDADEYDPRFAASIKKKSHSLFFKAGTQSKTFKALWPIYDLLFKHRAIRSWREFIKFMLTKPEATRWLDAYFGKLAVVYKENQRKALEKNAEDDRNGIKFIRKTHALVGGTADAQLDVAAWLLTYSKRDAEWIKLLQDATPAFLERWFSMRLTTVWLFMVLSESDWELLNTNKSQANMHKLWFGIFVIVTEDGYRIVKRENKGRSGEEYSVRNDQAGDFDIDQFDNYPFLTEFLDMVVYGIEKITGYAITATSSQPNVYMSKNERTKGWFQLLQAHVFPFQGFAHGNKHCITANLKHVGKIMTVKLDPEAALPKSETKQDIWQSDKRGKQLAKVTVRVKVDGDEYETNLGKCPFAFAPREEFYLPFYGANKSNTKRMKDTMQRLYDRIKTAIKTQSFDGEIGLISGKPMNQKSLELSSAVLDLEFTYCGRHGSGNRHLQSKNYFKQCDDPDVTRKLKTIVKELIKRESHINEKVVLNNYEAFKNMSDFTSLTGSYNLTDKWSSHPHCRPNSSKFPNTFVEDNEASGSLKKRCQNMHSLTIDEQNAQLFWFANLELVWQHRAQLDDFCSSKTWHDFKSMMDASLKEAQAKWDEKFGKGWTESAAEAINSVIEMVSPRKKRKRNGASESSKRVKHCNPE